MKYNDKQFDTWYIYTILDIDSECRGFQFYKRLTDFRRTLCQAQNVWAVQLSSRGAQVRWGGPNGTLGCHPYPYLNWYLYYITLHDLYLSAYDSCLYMFLYVLYVFNCLQLFTVWSVQWVDSLKLTAVTHLAKIWEKFAPRVALPNPSESHFPRTNMHKPIRLYVGYMGLVSKWCTHNSNKIIVHYHCFLH